jgi:MFS family permease
MVIMFRLFQGAFSSVCLTNGGGIIADTIPQQQRGFAIGMFTVGILAGPVVGPVPGSFLAAAKGWRWVFWLISILVRYANLHFPDLKYTNASTLDGLYDYYVLHILARVVCSSDSRS